MYPLAQRRSFWRMHEFSLVVSMLDIAEDAARAEGARRITRIHVEIGALAGVVPEALTFAFEGARIGTLAADAQLEVTYLPAIAYCAVCAKVFELDNRWGIAMCPDCDTPSGDLRQGRELQVADVTVES
jgi:hydrogenase nickel incorporation protein HypA/HybF